LAGNCHDRGYVDGSNAEDVRFFRLGGIGFYKGAIYVSDSELGLIRKFENGVVSTFMGKLYKYGYNMIEGSPSEIVVNNPGYITSIDDGLLIAMRDCIRKVMFCDGVCEPVFYCHGTSRFNNSVCNSQGTCMASNTCQCNNSYSKRQLSSH